MKRLAVVAQREQRASSLLGEKGHFVHIRDMSLRFWVAFGGLLCCHAAGADSLLGKVMCGYQGWFVTPADGEGMGWRHYGFNKSGQCHID
ncbi:MAG: hypothetical protein ACK56I_31390, partial [bacterium]